MVARGPRYSAVDASIFKEFPIPKVGRLEFQAEAFNLFNNVQFGQPSNTGGYATTNATNDNGFSTIYGLRNKPRLLQFALKLYY